MAADAQLWTCTYFQGAIHLVHLADLYGNEKTIKEVYPVKRKLQARVVFINPESKVSYNEIIHVCIYCGVNYIGYFTSLTPMKDICYIFSTLSKGLFPSRAFHFPITNGRYAIFFQPSLPI